MFAFRYHGNYAGPGWSAGRYQRSVARSKVKPIDEFDRTAQQHDRAYALNKNLKEADYKFYKQNVGKGVKRTLAALAVGTQGFLRTVPSSSQKEKKMSPTPRRGRSMSISTSRSRSRGFTPARKVLRFGMSPRASPGFMIRRGGVYKKKRPSMYGATSSKSKGFVKKAKSGNSVWDHYAKKGIITVSEFGKVVDGGVNGQSVLLQHSTHGIKQIVRIIAYSMCKRVLNEIGRNVEDVSEEWVRNAERSQFLRITYKNNPTLSAAEFDINIFAGTSIDSVAGSVQTFLLGAIGTQSRFQLERVQLFESSLATSPTLFRERIVDLSLQKATVNICIKSSLKIQNRTINAAGNDEADDVDNVPLHGKLYDGKGNHMIFNQVYYNAVSSIDYNFNDDKFLVTSSLSEPPIKSVLGRVNKSGKLHLDPGEIKTSVLESKSTTNLNKMISYLGQGGATSNILNIGKFRAFIVEKMLKAIGTTETNSVKVAMEIDLRTACIFNAPKYASTTQVVLIPLI